MSADVASMVSSSGFSVCLMNGAWAQPDGSIPGIWREEARDLSLKVGAVHLVMVAPRTVRKSQVMSERNTFHFARLPRGLSAQPRPIRLPFEVLALARTLIGLLRKTKIDVLRCDDTIISGLAGLVLGRVFGIPVCIYLAGSVVETAVLNSRSIGGKQIGRMVGLLERWVLGNADGVIAVNRALEERATQCGAHKVIPSQPYVDVSLFLCPVRGRVEGESGRNTVLCYVGRLEKEKGVRDLVTAFSLLANWQKNVELRIAGYGSEFSRLQAMIRDLQVEGRVQFLGPVPHRNVPQVLHEADIFVLPSYTEGSPVAALEAMLSGLPLISTPVGAIPDFLIANEDYLRVPIGKVEDLARAMALLVDNTAKRFEVARSGSLKARAAAEGYIERQIACYQQLTTLRETLSKG